ncbi:MAG: hypothetical protein GXO47_00195 [Chlorobi bacterium]|nr:hypothetical protein [Chlorobiota bacterium]
MKQHFFKTALTISVIFFVWSCANMGYPTGGPKDEEPPYIKKSNPEPGALNFKGKKITIEFNELLKLNNVNQKLIVSPPMNKKPYVVSHGKSIQIEFEEDLQPNTTYTLDFGDAIADNNEGNVIPSFTFSFSTGKTVDTLQVSGNLFEADDLSPADGVMVMLYDNLADSAFKTVVPSRLAKTDIKGHFTIKNVRPGKYRIYALDDKSNNYKFTNPGDRIAWLDTIIEPSYEYRTVIDSIKINVDSLTIDSVVVSKKLFYIPDSLLLFLFQQDYKQQYLVSDERKEKAKLQFIFNRTLERDLKIDITGHEDKKDWHLTEKTPTNDTVTIWLTDSAMYNRDSLSFTLTYPVRDSLNNLIDKIDTLTMYYFEKALSKREKKKKKKSSRPKTPHIRIKGPAGKLNVYAPNSITLPAPAVKFDFSAVHLWEKADTIMKPVKFDFWQDTLNIRKYYIWHKWEPGGVYVMTIDSAAIEDIYHTINFPVEAKFKVKELSDYSKIYIQFENPGKDWLLQLLSIKEKVLQSGYVPENGKIAFQYINPGDYMLRIVVDKNRNKKWDTGNYDKKIQPEKLMYYPSKINLRANWDNVITDWDPNNFNIYKFSEKFRKPSSSKKRD